MMKGCCLVEMLQRCGTIFPASSYSQCRESVLKGRYGLLMDKDEAMRMADWQSQRLILLVVLFFQNTIVGEKCTERFLFCGL